jgi:hypothetical protein
MEMEASVRSRAAQDGGHAGPMRRPCCCCWPAGLCPGWPPRGRCSTQRQVPPPPPQRTRPPARPPAAWCPPPCAGEEDDPLDAFMAGEVLPEVQAKQQEEARRKAEEKLKLAREIASGKVGGCGAGGRARLGRGWVGQGGRSLSGGGGWPALHLGLQPLLQAALGPAASGASQATALPCPWPACSHGSRRTPPPATAPRGPTAPTAATSPRAGAQAAKHLGRHRQ